MAHAQQSGIVRQRHHAVRLGGQHGHKRALRVVDRSAEELLRLAVLGGRGRPAEQCRVRLLGGREADERGRRCRAKGARRQRSVFLAAQIVE